MALLFMRSGRRRRRRRRRTPNCWATLHAAKSA
jgi:hypothetical protein